MKIEVLASEGELMPMDGELQIRVLGDCAQFFSGGTPSKNKPSYWQGNIPWVSCKDMKVPRLYDAEDHLSEEGSKNGTRLVSPETILIVVRGMILAKEFPVAMAMRDVAFNQDLKALRCKGGVDPWFLYYWLLANSYEIRGLVDEAAHGTKRLQTDRLLSLEVKLPPLKTQRKIATILSAYDDLIENNTRRIKILEEMAQTIYREWFVNFRFPGHERVKLVDSPLGMIPEGWEVSTLGDIAKEVRRSVDPEKLDPETPYVGLEHIPRKSITLSDWGFAKDIQSTKLLFEKGEILFGKIRPYFHKVSVAPINGICSSDAIVISAKETAHRQIVLGCVSSVEFVSHATQTSQGTKMPRANWKVLVQYPLIIPPIHILDQFNAFMDNVVNQTKNLMFKNRNLRQTRDLLLPKLISGEIDIATLSIPLPETTP